MSTLTHAEKAHKYRANKYTFPIPSVTTDAWTDADWIRFIDRHGVWL